MTASEPSEGPPHPQGLTERQATFSVLGSNLDPLAFAALRQWGPRDSAQQRAQRPELDGAIRPPRGDLGGLRLTCRLANKLVDAAGPQAPRRRQQLGAVKRRCARALSPARRDIQMALHPGQAQADLAHPRMLP